MLFAIVPLSQMGRSLAWMPVSTGPTTGPVGSINAHPVHFNSILSSSSAVHSLSLSPSADRHASRYATLLNQAQCNASRPGMTANVQPVSLLMIGEGC